MKGLISAELTSATVTEILGHVNAIKALMPWLLGLTTTERQTIPKMDDGRFPFVQKSITYGEQRAEILPPYVDVPELTIDLELFKQLEEVTRSIVQLAEMVSDTRMAAGSDAYVVALQIYNTVKMAAAAKVPGTDVIVKDLAKLFAHQSKTDEQTSENPEDIV